MGASDQGVHRRIGAPQGGLPLPDRRRASTPTTSIRRTTSHAYFLRSPHAHAKIRSIDTAKAKAAPGVVAIFTGADLEGVNGLPCGWLITGTDGKPMNEPPHPVLAQGKVRYVGDHGRARHRRDAEPGEGRGRADRRRLRGAAGGRQLRRRAEAGRAADPRRRAGQQVLHVGARRQGGGRRGVRQGGARDEARHRQQPADPERDRAARRRRVVQPRRRQLHALRRRARTRTSSAC